MWLIFGWFSLQEARSLVLSPTSDLKADLLARMIKERRYFVSGFLVAIAIVFLLRVATINDPSFLGLALYGTLISRVFFIYFVFRFSRALADPIWLTGLWCLLAPFSGLYVIPIIGLLITAHQEIRRKRHV